MGRRDKLSCMIGWMDGWKEGVYGVYLGGHGKAIEGGYHRDRKYLLQIGAIWKLKVLTRARKIQ